MSVQAGWFLRIVCTESCNLLTVIFDVIFKNICDCDRHAVLTLSNSRKLRFAGCFEVDPYVAPIVCRSEGKSRLQTAIEEP